MNLTDLLTKVKKTTEKKAAELEAEWWKAVRDVAAGKAVDATKVADLLERLGKTGDEFAAAVRLHGRRVELAAAAAAEPDALKQKAEAEAALAELKAGFEAAEAKYDADCRPYLIAVQTAVRAVSDAGSARSELFHDCPSPALRARLASVAADIRAVEVKMAEARERVSRCRAATRAGESQSEWGQRHEGFRHRGVDYTRAVAEAKERLPIREKELTDLTAERDRLIEEQAAVEDEMRQP